MFGQQMQVSFVDQQPLEEPRHEAWTPELGLERRRLGQPLEQFVVVVFECGLPYRSPGVSARATAADSLDASGSAQINCSWGRIARTVVP